MHGTLPASTWNVITSPHRDSQINANIHHGTSPTKRATASGVRSSVLDSNLVSASVTLLRQLHKQRYLWSFASSKWSQIPSEFLWNFKGLNDETSAVSSYKQKLCISFPYRRSAEAVAKFQREQGLRIPTGTAWAPYNASRRGQRFPKAVQVVGVQRF